eukprot:TRINITY_DN6323_c1_g1_i2.p1 TRINITY_DN6323_c1_g1~~TRINITY_DN6323_c1_g1_i2.p1  ORF type:complete len:238 (+),score=49.81 TRINITY_DN6323_c1_g1_i2:80-793(+)
MAQKRQQDDNGGQKKAKKQKGQAEAYEDGERGFLVTGYTCQDALRGAKDLRLWLEVEAELPNGTEPQTGGATAAASLEAELAELTSGDASNRRFLSVGMVCKQVAFLRSLNSVDVPSRLATRFLAPNANKRFLSRFADQVLPVDCSSRPKQENFKSLAHNVLSPHAGRKWRLVYEPFRGGWNTISKEDALNACKEHLGADNLNVSEPEVTVLCTVSPRFVSLTALELDSEYLRVEDE